MRRLTTILALLLPIFAFAIETPNPTANIWPQSPKAAQIREVSMPAPALLTGACEYSVPLYTISVEGVEIPLTLSYRSNGIKPDDDPYPIGYGWTLTPSLRVSRQIMGRPDERAPFVGESTADFEKDYMLCYKSITDKREEVRPSDPEYILDPEHDIYWVNLPNTSLTLVLDNGKLIGPCCEEYRINVIGNLDGIEVTDPQGVIYTFDIKGEAIDKLYNTTEWLLNYITLPSGRKIDFDWGDLLNNTGPTITRFPPKNLKYSSVPPQYTVENDPLGDNPDYMHRYINTRYLRSITFPGGLFTLNYDDARHIATGFSVIGKFNNGGSMPAASGTFTHEGERDCLLKSVEISGQGSYEFIYDPRRFEPNYEIDLWGYYTGRYSGYDYISPKVKFKKGEDDCLPSPYTIYGPDRSVDTLMMRANILTAVKVPTGGRIEWDYEPHKFDTVKCTNTYINERIDDLSFTYGGGLRVKSIKSFVSDDDTSPRTRHYVYGPGGNGHAVVEAAPFMHTFVSECDLLVYRLYSDPIMGIYLDKFLSLNIGSDYMTGRGGEQPIWYSHITEIEEEGKTEYKFTRYTQPNKVYRRWGVAAPQQNFTQFSKGPQLTSTKVYAYENGSYNLLEETTNSYRLVSCSTKEAVGSVFIRRKTMQIDNAGLAPDCGEELYLDLPIAHWMEYSIVGGSPYMFYQSDFQWFEAIRYTTFLQTEQLVSTEHKDYRENGTIGSKTTNFYVSGTSLVQRSVLSNSSGTTTTEYSYAEAQSPSVSAAMMAANVVGVPTLVTETFGSAKVGYRLEMQQCDASCFRPAKVWNIAGNETWSTADFDYDRFGDLTVAATADGCTTVTEWAEGLYPVKSTLGGKLVSTAEWRPLVGVTKLTAPASPTLHFAYDQCGRLVLTTENGITTESHSYSITPDGLSYVSSRAYAVTEGVPSSETTTYYDGLGRPWCAHTASGEVSVATLTEYDGMGRPWRQWAGVPMSSAPTSVASFRSAATSFYNTTAAFSQNAYEPSPRRLTTAVTRPGDGWDTRPATVRRLTNSSPWPMFVPTESGVSKSGTYPAGSLSVEGASDEDGVTVTKYVDMRGLTIAEDRGGLVIHYVYDDFGRLRYVLPPGMNLNASSISRSSAEMQGIAYWYDYDSRGRCTSKKLPDVDPITYYYDPADRLVVEFNPAFVNDCRVYGYDYAGRMVVTAEGDMTAAQARTFASSCRTATFGGGTLAGYSISGLPSGFEAVTASYYDSYNFITSLSLPSNFSQGGSFTLAGGNILNGLLTGAYTGAGYEAYHYDSRMRMKVRVATGFNEGRTEFEYNNGGAVISEKWIHPDGSVLADRGLTRETSYDSGGRISGHTVTQARNPLNDVPVIQPLSISMHDKDVATLTMEYDALGRLSATNLNGTQANRITTSYNIHSWPTARAFISGGTTKTSETYTYAPFYNGNMASKQTYLGTYSYSYDGNNRLVDANFSNDDEYSTRSYSTAYEYDHRGNVTSIVRDGIYVEVPSVIRPPVIIINSDGADEQSTGPVYDTNDLIGTPVAPEATKYRRVDYTFTYDGNQASHVDIVPQRLASEITQINNGGDFEYDAAGRMVSDGSRGITSIEYDSNSHPRKIMFSDGSSQEEVWDDLGNHLSTVNHIYKKTQGVTTSHVITTRNYHGSGQIVENDSLVMTRFSGGFFDGDGKVKFYLSDYQGNNIAVIDANGEIVEKMGYYPYGMPWKVPDSTPYLFADKEYQHLSGLHEYIHGARRNVPYACAFSTPDPLCEDRRWESPYLFCSGNPIRNIDPSGEEPTPYEALMMINYVYEGGKGCKLEGGWMLHDASGTIKSCYDGFFENGLTSGVFKRKTGIDENGNDVYEYAYAFAGTEGLNDLIADIMQLSGESSQYETALNNAKALSNSEEMKNAELTFIGHSLGGGEAAASSMATGRKAITFNPAAVSPKTIKKHNLGSANNVVNYRAAPPNDGVPIGGCFVNNLQDNLGMHAPGHTIYVELSTHNPYTAHKLIQMINYFSKRR